MTNGDKGQNGGVIEVGKVPVEKLKRMHEATKTEFPIEAGKEEGSHTTTPIIPAAPSTEGKG